MINKLSALLFANNFLVEAALAGYHCDLNVGQDGSTSEVEVTVFCRPSQCVSVHNMLHECSLPFGSHVETGFSNGAFWYSLFIPFEK